MKSYTEKTQLKTPYKDLHIEFSSIAVSAEQIWEKNGDKENEHEMEEKHYRITTIFTGIYYFFIYKPAWVE